MEISHQFSSFKFIVQFNIILHNKLNPGDQLYIISSAITMTPHIYIAIKYVPKPLNSLMSFSETDGHIWGVLIFIIHSKQVSRASSKYLTFFKAIWEMQR